MSHSSLFFFLASNFHRRHYQPDSKCHHLSSGKLTERTGKIHHVQWVNPMVNPLFRLGHGFKFANCWHNRRRSSSPMGLPRSVLHTTWISSSQGIPQFPLEVAAGQIEIPCGEHGPGVCINAFQKRWLHHLHLIPQWYHVVFISMGISCRIMSCFCRTISKGDAFLCFCCCQSSIWNVLDYIDCNWFLFNIVLDVPASISQTANIHQHPPTCCFNIT